MFQPNMFVIQKYTAQFQKLCHPGIRVLVLAIVLIAFVVSSFQGFTLAPGNGSSLLLPAFGEGNSSSDTSSASNDSKIYEHHNDMGEAEEDLDDLDVDGEESQEDDELSIDLGNGVRMKKLKDPYGGYIALEKSVGVGEDSSAGMQEGRGTGSESASSEDTKANSSLGRDKERNLEKNCSAEPPSSVSYPAGSYINRDVTQVKEGNDSSGPVLTVAADISSEGERKTEANQTIARSEEKNRVVKKRRKRRPAMAISEINQMLLRNRGSFRSMKPRWPSPTDWQIVKAKKQIVNAPIIGDDLQLYSPVFRNVSMFKRSYELMEEVLKVYVYKEGDKPIFHDPHLTGIYASEGWFMKHMEASKQFVVDDPNKAHLFYMPFSSKNLRTQLYVPGSHNRTNMSKYLKHYVGTITTKYPFWNRTAGADHFLAACHDWAATETGLAMGNSIKALCSADVTKSFVVGKDVSLPQSNVPTEKDPLRDVGGRPAKNRPLLAFFAGQMHGYLRPVLLRHWQNKDPDMKVLGQLLDSNGRRRSMAYAQYMKSSKYCICPRGSEVNSPRMVESIFYGCVPVIISDNFVPPFFEVLNWEAFSVVVVEDDVPRLKEILVSIPRKKYMALQMGVRKVQQHFLWHNRPVKYDMFHMILHSIWFNRVFTFQ